MSKNNHLRGLNKQLKEKNPIINTLMQNFNNDMDDDDMVIENAVYGMDDDDMDSISGAFESSYGDEFENQEYLDFDDLIEDHNEDDESIDDGIDPDLGEDEDDSDDFDDDENDVEDEEVDLEDVMEAASIFDDIESHFNPRTYLDNISLDFLDDEL